MVPCFQLKSVKLIVQNPFLRPGGVRPDPQLTTDKEGMIPDDL